MTVYTEILGNVNRDHEWAHRLENCETDYVILDQWTAQKSRFASTSDRGNEYAVSLERNGAEEPLPGQRP